MYQAISTFYKSSDFLEWGRFHQIVKDISFNNFKAVSKGCRVAYLDSSKNAAYKRQLKIHKK